jgi:pimeloyl-ACP methyl ester carboxylesterase
MNSVHSADGTAIAYDRSGEGPALVLVGGALSTRADATSQAQLLAPRFAVVAYDRRGRGASGDRAPYAVEREIEDLDALIDDAGGTAYLYGHSSGAVLALEAARRLSGKVTRLAVYEPPFIVDASRPPVPADYVAHVHALVATGRRGDAVAYFMRDAVLVPDEVITQMRTSPIWPGLEAIAHTLVYDGAVMGESTLGDPAPVRAFVDVAVPTLVMDGGASPEWIHHAAGLLTETLPDARRQTLEGQTHAADPGAIAHELMAFFTGA